MTIFVFAAPLQYRTRTAAESRGEREGCKLVTEANLATRFTAGFQRHEPTTRLTVYNSLQQFLLNI